MPRATIVPVQTSLKYTESSPALERVLQLADQSDLQGEELEIKEGIAKDYLELSAGYEDFQPPDEPIDPLDPLSPLVTPAKIALKHYRVFYVAARIWMEDPTVQALESAENGVAFSRQIRPILSLLESQEGYDEQHCLAIPERWDALDLKLSYAAMAGIELQGPSIMSAFSA